jgi:hypothetical protein
MKKVNGNLIFLIFSSGYSSANDGIFECMHNLFSVTFLGSEDHMSNFKGFIHLSIFFIEPSKHLRTCYPFSLEYNNAVSHKCS